MLVEIEELAEAVAQGILDLVNKAAPDYTPLYAPLAGKLSLSRLTDCPRKLILSFISAKGRGALQDMDALQNIIDELQDIEDEEEKIASNIGILAFGIWWEEFIAQYVAKDYRRQCWTQYMGIPGHIDFLKHDEGSGQVHIIETKTTSNLPENNPRFAHYIQASAYMLGVLENGYAYRDENDKLVVIKDNIREVKGTLLYVYRENPQLMTVFNIVPDEVLIKQVIDKILNTWREFEEGGIIPDKDARYVPFRPPCCYEAKTFISRCPFHEYCWGRAGEMSEQDMSRMANEAFRRWLSYKEAEQNYRRFMDELFRPIFPSEGTLLVKYLDTPGVLRVYNRSGQRRIDIDALKSNIEQALGVSFSNTQWKQLVEESKIQGEATIVYEFRRMER